MGLPLSYDLRPARLDQTRRIMNEFSIAYLKSDREALAAVLTDDFVWHVHDGEDSAHGKTYHGVDAMLTVLAQRAEDWSDTSYSEIEFHASGDRVFQQFRVKGNDRRFGRFDSYGIDIYVIRDGRIASKDSYWKRQTQ